MLNRSLLTVLITYVKIEAPLLFWFRRYSGVLCDCVEGVCSGNVGKVKREACFLMDSARREISYVSYGRRVIWHTGLELNFWRSEIDQWQ